MAIANKDYTAVSKRFGEEFTVVLVPLESEVFRLISEWQTYRSLFGTNPHRTALILGVGGQAAEHIEYALWNSILIGICRLGDPAKDARKNKNLSIKRLKDVLDDHDFWDELNQVTDEFCASLTTLRRVRRKRIAHNDFNVAVGSEKLQEQSRKDIQTSLDLAINVIRSIYRQVGVHQCMKITGSSGGALSLLHHLYLGREAERETGRSHNGQLPDFLMFDREWDN